MNAFIVCSRLSSFRIPEKPLTKYSGKTQIEILVKNLLESGLPVFLAVPEREVIQYSFLNDIFKKNFTLFGGNEDDPLARQFDCAEKYGIKNIIRVTHDKMFVDIDKVSLFLTTIEKNDLDYVYSSDFIPGTGFEVISQSALRKARHSFSRVEHISYAIKAVTDKIKNIRFNSVKKDIRLLIDYKEDIDLMQVITSTLSTDAKLKDVVRFMDKNRFLKKINKLPLVTIYTCAYNAQKWIDEAMKSVSIQRDFQDYEYIIIDDHSSDKTLLSISKFCFKHKNSRFIRNNRNVGLASSSNIALKNARGKYIVRLDADDFFINKNSVKNMVEAIEQKSLDVIYSNCYAGLSMRKVQKGNQNHHVGGALFNTSAINHLKFTDNLRNHDSLDIFLRAKDHLKIGYFDKIVFCYRQHNRSMSKNNLEERNKIKKTLEEMYV